MLKFNEIIIDRNRVFLKSEKDLYNCLENMYVEDKENFSELFGNMEIKNINCELASISHIKNFEIEGLHYFDESSEFNIYINIYVYKYDEDNEKELLCYYRSILDEKLNTIDDMLFC